MVKRSLPASGAAAQTTVARVHTHRKHVGHFVRLTPPYEPDRPRTPGRLLDLDLLSEELVARHVLVVPFRENSGGSAWSQ